MDFNLSQTQSQKLILSPQVRQYLKFLQLPIQQLSNAIEQEVTENPALEETTLLNDDLNSDEEFNQNQDSEESNKDSTSELDFQEKLETLDKLDENLKDSFYPDLSKSSFSSSKDEDEKRDYQQSLITQEETLIDFLTFQINTLTISDKERALAFEIIGYLNEDGYLTTPIAEIATEINNSSENIEKCLIHLQNFDPPGVCARNLKECLLIQINRMNTDTHLAKVIVEEYISLLEKKDYIKLSKKTKASIGKIKEACLLIQNLEPKPGRSFYKNETLSVIPDANIYIDSETDELVIEMNEESLPQIRVNHDFKRMLKDKNLDEKTKDYIKNKVNAAFWTIKALSQRQSTLKQITHQIVESQKEFLEKGFSALKPLRLKDIAKLIGVHESTVSRAIQGKYIRTTQGTIPYKSFFSTRMESLEGSESQKSVLEKIKRIVQKENPSKPFSDEQLVELLKSDGIKVARRTIAKYRGILKILPSYLRKHH